MTHISCMGTLSQKRSPLVQSGDRSHPAKIMAGDTMTVSTQSIAFTACIASLSHLFCSSLFFGVNAVGVVGALAPLLSPQRSAYDWFTFRVPVSILTKYPPIATRKRRVDVMMFFIRLDIYLYIEVLDHNCIFFANIHRVFCCLIIQCAMWSDFWDTTWEYFIPHGCMDAPN